MQVWEEHDMFAPEMNVLFEMEQHYQPMYDQTQYVLTVRAGGVKKQASYVLNDEIKQIKSIKYIQWNMIESLQLTVHPALFEPLRRVVEHLSFTKHKSQSLVVPISGFFSDEELMNDYDHQVRFHIKDDVWIVYYRPGGDPKLARKPLELDMKNFYDVTYYQGSNMREQFSHYVSSTGKLNAAQIAHMRNILNGVPMIELYEDKSNISHDPFAGVPMVGRRPEILNGLKDMLKIHVYYPCRCANAIVGGIEQRATLERMIIHLNDKEQWTREAIADWLDLLAADGTINIDIQSPQEDKA